MGSSALIGSTGFVGGNLHRQGDFTDLYNSANIHEIRGREYDLIVCAGARAEKWKINLDPESDVAAIASLTGHLSAAEAARLVLISTVDVYPSPVDVDESSPIDRRRLSAYGAHRLDLEQWAAANFDTTVLRLPGLFGPGLKKNVIFDFLNDNNLDRIDAADVFQFYDVRCLWADLERILELGAPVVNLATEPVSVAEVALECFGMHFSSRPASKTAIRYDYRSRYANELDGRDGYLYDQGAVLKGIADFVSHERTR